MSNGKAEAEKENTEGWTWLSNATKWHYFIREDGKSLCGKWGLFGSPELEQGDDDSEDNCKACQKKLEARQTKLKKGGKA